MPTYIGTSGWSYPSGEGKWKGIFYPARWKGDELAYYAERFPAVEVNSTFYRLPSVSTVNSWIERTPPGFLFTAKLYRKFTHPDFYARETGQLPEITTEDIADMRAVLDALMEQNRLGAVLAQFPEFHRKTAETTAALVRLLDAFRNYPLAVEIRHPSWQTGETREILEGFNAALARIDEPFFSNLDDPVAPKHTLQYWRFHGRNAAEWRKKDAGLRKYDYLYTIDEIDDITHLVDKFATPSGKNFLFFNNHLHSKAVVNAVEMAKAMDMDLPYGKFADLSTLYPELSDITGPTGGQLGLL